MPSRAKEEVTDIYIPNNIYTQKVYCIQGGDYGVCLKQAYALWQWSGCIVCPLCFEHYIRAREQAYAIYTPNYLPSVKFI